ncbi:cytochrome P450 [Bisporella sp. PMI_857]|nr:cytochrome P450 [Bisporella sp. PMI_857]
MLDQACIPFAVAVLVLGLVKVIDDYTRGSKYKLPLQVPGVPFFGNALQIPPSQQGPWPKELDDKYGEMFTVKLNGQTWVFLNSSRVVYDLMERRAGIYCSRPPFPMTQGIMSGDSRTVLMPYGEKWREVRKVMHNILGSRQLNLYKAFQELESRHLLYDYLHNPDRWFSANGRYSNSVIMNVVFGRRSDLGDPDVEELFETVEEFLREQQPGMNLVDGFPILANLPKPLQWWRPKGQRIFEKTRNVYKRELDRLSAKIAAGTARDCFAMEFFKAINSKTDETQTIFTLGTLMEAGSDTTRVSLGQIIAGAATYPDWVVRAREQLDAVCGDAQRLPEFADRKILPYITAVVKEGFRWRPNIAEIGAPTLLIKDDEYEGYKFKAGTIFTWNAWAISLSPKEYEQPERFWPERFMNEDLNNTLKGHWAFGPGRRVCVGWSVGESNVWIAIARLIYCFDFHQVPFTGNKAQFDVDIKVRSAAHAALIERDCFEAVNTKY